MRGYTDSPFINQTEFFMDKLRGLSDQILDQRIMEKTKNYISSIAEDSSAPIQSPYITPSADQIRDQNPYSYIQPSGDAAQPYGNQPPFGMDTRTGQPMTPEALSSDIQKAAEVPAKPKKKGSLLDIFTKSEMARIQKAHPQIMMAGTMEEVNSDLEKGNDNAAMAKMLRSGMDPTQVLQQINRRRTNVALASWGQRLDSAKDAKSAEAVFNAARRSLGADQWKAVGPELEQQFIGKLQETVGPKLAAAPDRESADKILLSEVNPKYHHLFATTLVGMRRASDIRAEKKAEDETKLGDVYTNLQAALIGKQTKEYDAIYANFLRQAPPEMRAKLAQRYFEMKKSKQAEEKDAFSKSKIPSEDAVASTAQMVMNGLVAPSELPGFGANSIKTKVIEWLGQNAPGFNLQQADLEFLAKKKTVNTVNSPQWQGTLTYLRSVRENMDHLSDLSKAYKRTDYIAANSIQEAIQKNTGNPQVVAYLTATAEVGDQIAKILQGGGAGGSGSSDFKMRQALEILNTKYSPEQFETVLKELKVLLSSREKEMLNVSPVMPGGGQRSGNESFSGTPKTADEWLMKKGLK